MQSNKLNILIADDEQIVHETLSGYLKDSGHSVTNCRDGMAALNNIEQDDYDLALVDIRMPGIDGLSLLKKIQDIKPFTNVVIITGHGSMETAIDALRSGAVDFLPKPIKLLELDAVLEKSQRLQKINLERQHYKEIIRGIQASDKLNRGDERLIGNSPAIKEVHRQIKQIVTAHVNRILISGETGTGKELVARAIHGLAAGDEYPFIAVNCPALPETLAESELFGHIKGAFTGAGNDRAGYFELADGGTLFLDEISDLTPAIQAKLLRVLETEKIRRVGGNKELSIRVRVIAASNQDLASLIRKGKFRKDLYYRLNLFPIHIAPLRERKEDILILAQHFLQKQAKQRKRPAQNFSAKNKNLLLNYTYPGNVRELLNIVERAVIVCNEKEIQPKHIHIQGENIPSHHSSVGSERDMILNALENARWNRRQAAKDLNMPYSTLRFKMAKLDIS